MITPIPPDQLPEFLRAVTHLAFVAGFVGACACYALRTLVLAVYSFLTRRRREREWLDDLAHIAAEIRAFEAKEATP
ncbi:hypothetical protein [Luteimonas sp. RC10]|uniref:hypothetical protein n=1 Tax=Luteimonas sp. RC10 TaxID=2587035 RepID=UPI0016195AD2|nr:hypothetical protein [Luteimonas sp. RC10]MBB3344520.1 hypothetical protein [Luteimonas sp. RC10]